MKKLSRKISLCLTVLIFSLGVFSFAHATTLYSQPLGDAYKIFPTATSSDNLINFTSHFSGNLPGYTTILYLYGGPTAGGLVGYETYCPSYSVTAYGGNYTGPDVPWRYGSFFAISPGSYSFDSSNCSLYFRNSGYDLKVYGHYFGSVFYPAITVTDGSDPGDFIDMTSASTTIYSVSPDPVEGDVVATSTNFFFGIDGYVSSSDFATDTVQVDVSYVQLSGMCVRGNPCSASSGTLIVPIYSPGSFSTTTLNFPLLYTGVYQATYTIQKPNICVFTFCFGTHVLAQRVVPFVVSMPSAPVTQDEVDRYNNFVVDSGAGVQLGATTTGSNTPLYQGSPYDQASSSGALGLSTAFSLTGLLNEKFPINWVYQSSVILIDLVNSTSSDELSFAPVVVDFSDQYGLGRFHIASSTFKYSLFSTTTLNAVADKDWAQTMRWLVSAGLWIALISFTWREVMRMWNNK
jgi:hypothetical protein